MSDRSNKCQGKNVGLSSRPCRSDATMTFGDRGKSIRLCDKCWGLYLLVAEDNPEEANRIRKKVGMRNG